ncbi:MAG: MTAP family purine nucleoside phosphorylase [Candidatus Aenigmarchaeota archaeon]|nr:MTAP family purine nucleoside phosphorylase [Candidatus Aenigmarchaeota archaeon]
MIGIFGGSGFYSLLEGTKEKAVETPFGKTSSKITIGRIGNTDVAFMARHGTKHEYPPHNIPYKANVWAFKELGVERIISPTAVGSLKKDIKPGEFLVPNQFISFTHRDDSFYNGPEAEAKLGAKFGGTVHISPAEPYCPELIKTIVKEGRKMGLTVHDGGTLVVIQGPRFASSAESDFFRRNEWDVINMTSYPELMLARELEMCYANIAIITDYDTGLRDDPSIKPVTIEEIVRVFRQNNEKIKKLILDIIPKLPKERNCICANALEGARP